MIPALIPVLGPSPWWLPACACLLDRLLGDPPRFPHPVRLIGAWLAWIEAPLRRAGGATGEFWAGLLGLCLTLVLTGLVAGTLSALPVPAILHVLVVLYLSFAGLALGQLLREGRRAARLLAVGDTAAARKAVGALVSRDVSRADGEELGRVLAESLSENFNDGFVAPLFWLTLGGPLGLWLYKAVSTMDSLWGYPHAPWTLFGRAAARADDALAYVPARLSALLLWLAGGLPRWLPGGFRAPVDYAVLRGQARSMKSPNAGWPMAMAALLHGRAMGGPAIYNGETVEKPRLGPERGVWDPPALARLLRHLQGAALLGVLGSVLVSVLGETFLQ